MLTSPNYFGEAFVLYLQDSTPESSVSSQFFTAIETWNNNATVHFLTGIQPQTLIPESLNDFGMNDTLESTKVQMQIGDLE
jgi:hypothetical protein